MVGGGPLGTLLREALAPEGSAWSCTTPTLGSSRLWHRKESAFSPGLARDRGQHIPGLGLSASL